MCFPVYMGVPDILSRNTLLWHVDEKKKKAQCESCELSFIWGQIRTIAQETASQIPLRKCPEEVAGRYICDFGEGGVPKINHIFIA